MLAVFARRFNPLSLSKAGYGIGLSSLLLLAGAGSVHDATALNETRTLSFHHTHSDEDLTVTFKRDGRYDEDALKKLNHYLRDWRTQDETVMDRHLFDILWEVYRDVDGKAPIQIISSYRSPATNAMLRRRSSGVARFSQHMLGHAMDFFIPGVPLEQIRFAGLRLQRGGVGFYPTSGSPFVHLDTGSIRHWPRMTHDQLARVFPDGRTVHVPTDGNPLKGYELARADIEKRGNGDDASTVSKPSLFARLFRGGKSSEEDEDAGAAIVNDKPAPATVVAAAKPVDTKSADPVPMPRSKPQFAAAIQLASADAQIVPAPRAKPAAVAEQAEPKPQTPADIINARGFWGDEPTTAKQASPAQVAALRAREAVGGRPAIDCQRAIHSHVREFQPCARLRAGGLLAGRPFEHRRSLCTGSAQHSPHAQCRRRCHRDQQRRCQGSARPGRRDHDVDPPLRCEGQRSLDADRVAGAKRHQRHADDSAWRYRHEPDARLLRQAAVSDRHDLLG